MDCNRSSIFSSPLVARTKRRVRITGNTSFKFTIMDYGFFYTGTTLFLFSGLQYVGQTGDRLADKKFNCQ